MKTIRWMVSTILLSLLLSCGGGGEDPSEHAVDAGRMHAAALDDCSETMTYGNGPGTSRDPTDPPVPGLPDFVTESIKIFGSDRYAYLQTETFQVEHTTCNEGDADWAGNRDDMYVMLLLSEGAEEDSHSDWQNIGMQQIKKGNIDVGECKKEYFTVNLATLNHGLPLAPGKYNLVGCPDRKEAKDNEDGEVPEKHKSNNCSTELVFDVLLDPNYTVQKPDLIITYIGMGDYNDTSIRKGNTKYPTLRIKNQGPGPVGALTRQRYYLYGPATGNVWREIDGDDTEASLLCTGCETTEQILKGYAINKTGIHYLKACADPDNRQPETDEGNNCKVSDPITVK